MPRKAWVADLDKLRKDTRPPLIQSVEPGDDDGEVRITVAPDNEISPFALVAMIPELSDYPRDHTYHIFADDDAPPFVSNVLEHLADPTGLDLFDLVKLISLAFAGGDADGDVTMIDSQFDNASEDDFDDGFDDEETFFTGIKPSMAPTIASNSNTARRVSSFSAEVRARIRQDLILCKDSNFRVGIYGALMEGGSAYVTAGIRISKLGLSDEALQAWQANASDYLILILHYPNGYISLDDLEGMDATTARQSIDFRIGCSDSYKPTIREATAAFIRLSQSEDPSQSPLEATGFRDVFISRALNQLFNDRLVTILRYRNVGLSWTAAEEFFNDHQGKSMGLGGADFLDDQYSKEEVVNRIFPEIVTSDHFTTTGTSRSLPLVAMQFLLRHFVRCTEFCLNCHCKLKNDLEAIKPYVCDKPLCLYQYMSLGFGPSIEHEIMSQPKVVDLLVSFCYSSAASQKLHDLPLGLALKVPSLKLEQSFGIPAKNPIAKEVGTICKYDPVTREMMFEKNQKCELKVGDWMVIRVLETPEVLLHARVKETTYFPTVRLSEPVQVLQDGQPSTTGTVTSINPVTKKASLVKKAGEEAKLSKPGFQDAIFTLYDQNFDQLPQAEQRTMVMRMLYLIPKIEEMKDYLSRHKKASLSSWTDRLPPAVTGILRWIIASNRACIVQSDGDSDESSGKIVTNANDRVYGMKPWLQFRFAMGAPDKEQRFIDAVNATRRRLSLAHPTIFAFHGSPLGNWHSIIREGLHFNTVSHGRAYGNGVYHSLDFNTSASYSHIYSYNQGLNATNEWPNSCLQIQSAMAVNELVNAPTEYVSRSPHLVVAQLDWIQTRFLFVRLGSGSTVSEPEVQQPSDPFPQDVNWTATGQAGKLIIPRSAIPRAGRDGLKPVTEAVKAEKRSLFTKLLKTKKQEDVSASKSSIVDDDSAYESAETDEEDNTILLDDSNGKQETNAVLPHKSNGLVAFGKSLFSSSQTTSLTDFVPGTLDYSSLPMMQEPTWSTPAASKRLQKDFQALVKIQDSTPAHELGWYVDPEKFNNVYQWIVELHSFDEKLPLAKQMKQFNMKSIVLEMRFGPDYPMSPPFVRVIRPRFLPFHSGGGGNVTLGGSLCMELLTNTGWSAVSSMESVLLSVHMAISDPERPAKIESSRSGDYSVHEAVDAYIRACQTHGWKVPPGFREMALGGGMPVI